MSAQTCRSELGIPVGLESNEKFVSYYGIWLIIACMKQNCWAKKCIHRFNVSHYKCTDMKLENMTSIADGYISCILTLENLNGL